MRTSSRWRAHRFRSATPPDCWLPARWASLAATQPVKDKFVEELWNAPIPSGHERYYDGMLYMMSLLHVTGNFRIWGPQ